MEIANLFKKIQWLQSLDINQIKTLMQIIELKNFEFTVTKINKKLCSNLFIFQNT